LVLITRGTLTLTLRLLRLLPLRHLLSDALSDFITDTRALGWGLVVLLHQLLLLLLWGAEEAAFLGALVGALALLGGGGLELLLLAMVLARGLLLLHLLLLRHLLSLPTHGRAGHTPRVIVAAVSSIAAIAATPTAAADSSTGITSSVATEVIRSIQVPIAIRIAVTYSA
jgi:hypothetical protein